MSQSYQSVNPSTGVAIDGFDSMPFGDAVAAAELTSTAQRAWAGRDLAERITAVRSLAAAMTTARAELAASLVAEIGKPIRQAEAEVDKCIALCEGYAGAAPALLADRAAISPGITGSVRMRPLGVVLGVMPWNFPYWQTLRFAIPNLLLGNACLIKPAPNSAMSALALARALAMTPLGPDLCRVVLVDEESVRGLIAHDAVAGVSVTGSFRAGQAIGAAAGQAVKKVVLELGGSDPFIVLADADVSRAAEAAATSRLSNAGQSCVAAKRFIIERPVYDEFVDTLVEIFDRQHVGDPASASTTVGPMARADLRAGLAEQVNASIEAGATVANSKLDGPAQGFFYPPTVLTDIPLAAPVWRDETFGPVAPVVAVDTADEAVALANDSLFGLGASIWTGSADRAEQLAESVTAGMVFVNDFVQSDWRLPFGGTRHSGHGRELAAEGISEFSNIKTYVANPG